MKIIISPAKKMNVREDLLPYETLPHFLEQAETLKTYLKTLDKKTLQQIWKCNDAIADLNEGRLRTMDLTKCLTPAVLSYDGLQYLHMSPSVFDDGQWQYVKEHLYILSGFYGLLRAADGIVPYRLEMQAKIDMRRNDVTYNNLYDFWAGLIAGKLAREAKLIVNLASKEYSKAVESHLPPETAFITCQFVVCKQDKMGGRKLVTKGTEAKMARGEMVRFMAERSIEEAEGLKTFDRLGYCYEEELSDSAVYVFVKRPDKAI